ncbi:Flp pilus assembly protein CpaB [Xanthobacter sp. DSM 14520]|uniref:Flp pilus assembly protein CpaB n=1 Tax=Xanthobacter autotrophicus (strain ATCC BAA-1158 / Py2) TaxID=78245 RepID=UPI00372BA1ED
MQVKRLMLSGIAIASGVLAFVLVLSSSRPPAGVPAPAVVQSAPLPSPVVSHEAFAELLVADRPLEAGERLKATDVKWQRWPADSVPAKAITRSAEPKAIDSIDGTAVRIPIGKGEPLTSPRVVRRGDAGFLATVLPSGMRAVAIPLDVRGGRSAGGFIFPQDRVDVLVTRVDVQTKSGPPSATTRSLLRDIRVLAIGQQISEPNGQGQRTVVGETATLEVSPDQAEALAAAVKSSSGEVTLALRPLGEKSNGSTEEQKSGSIVTVRYGVVR